jgi:hypothetical protein
VFKSRGPAALPTPGGLSCGALADIAAIVPTYAPVELDVNGFFADFIGQRGVTREAVAGLAGAVSTTVRGLEERRAAGSLPFYSLPY